MTEAEKLEEKKELVASQPPAVNANEKEEAADAPEGEVSQQRSPLKLIAYISVPLTLLLIVGGVLFFTHFGRSLIGLEKNPKGQAKVEAKSGAHMAETQYYGLPDLLINMDNTGTSRTSFLKLSLYLEVKKEQSKESLDEIKPKIVDQFQVYLRGLRPDDLKGSAGLQRLREELLLRANNVSGGIEIKNILFKEMLIQ